MAAGDRFARELHRQALHGQLVGGVARAKVAGDGIGCHVGGVFKDRCPGGLQIQRLPLRAVILMTTSNQGIATSAQLALQVLRLPDPLLVADQQGADGRSVTLDDGIGSQRGGKRNQPHIGRLGREDALHGLADADGQIVFGGQGFRRCQDAVGLILEQHRVGIGAAGINAENN